MGKNAPFEDLRSSGGVPFLVCCLYVELIVPLRLKEHPALGSRPFFHEHIGSETVKNTYLLTNSIPAWVKIVKLFLQKYKEDEPLFTSSLWGPSCDELDQIVESCLLPELNVGDWLIFDNMGADSFHEPSAFNDFQRPAIYYMMSFSDW